MLFYLFIKNYFWRKKVRAITVRAINLIPKEVTPQLNLYEDYRTKERKEKLECTVEDLRRRFGKSSVFSAVLIGNIKMTQHSAYELIMPGMTGI